MMLHVFISRTALLLFVMLVCGKLKAADSLVIDMKPFADASHHWYDIYDKGNVIFPKPDQARYNPSQIREVADNILLYQKNNGGWPKNYDILAILTEAQKDSLRSVKGKLNTTFDNGTTWSHVECLAKVYTATKEVKYREACIRGLQFILTAQYPNGGWPQYFPLEKNYSRHITYNDGVFTGILYTLQHVVYRKPWFAFIETGLYNEITKSYNKGITCILKTQIQDNGRLTAWCQQHDELSLAPAWARAFEPPSICNGESSDIVLLLMSIDHPSEEIRASIRSAVKWFDQSKILYTRIKTVAAPPDTSAYRVSKTDKVVVTDSMAPPVWTRYYELGTNRPMFCNRDGKIVYALAEVKRERRDGYGWYTYAPQQVLDKFQEWEQRQL